MVNRGMTSSAKAPRGDVATELRMLGSTPSFAGAPARMLEAAVRTGYIVRVGPQWPLLAQRTAPERAYVLLQGEVDVYQSGVDLGRCRPGEILGELGIVNRRLRVATVMTTDPITVLHLSRQAFTDLFDQEPYFRDIVGEAIDRKLG